MAKAIIIHTYTPYVGYTNAGTMICLSPSRLYKASCSLLLNLSLWACPLSNSSPYCCWPSSPLPHLSLYLSQQLFFFSFFFHSGLLPMFSLSLFLSPHPARLANLLFTENKSHAWTPFITLDICIQRKVSFVPIPNSICIGNTTANVTALRGRIITPCFCPMYICTDWELGRSELSREKHVVCALALALWRPVPVQRFAPWV